MDYSINFAAQYHFPSTIGPTTCSPNFSTRAYHYLLNIFTRWVEIYLQPSSFVAVMC